MIVIVGLLANGLVIVPIVQATPAGAIAITGCSLEKAIVAANQGSTAGTGCTFAGTGPQYTFTLTGDLSFSTELPAITSKLHIGAARYGYVIDQAASSAQFVLKVGSAGNLTLSAIRVTNTGGSADGVVVDEGGTFTLTNSTIDNIGNSGNGNSGIISLGMVVVNNSTISNSDSGLSIDGGSAILINSTVAGNLYYGVYIAEGASLIMSASTLANNDGLGLAVDGSVVIDSSVIAQDSACLVAQPEQLTSHGYNIESPGETCYLGVSSDRMGVPATGTGGLNLETTLAPNGPQSRPYTLALLAGSVAIDAIPTTSGLCSSDGGSMDERGNVRAGQVTAGDHRGGLACDAGAYEFDSTVMLAAVTVENLRITTAAAGPAPIFIGLALAAIGGVWVALRRVLQG